MYWNSYSRTKKLSQLSTGPVLCAGTADLVHGVEIFDNVHTPHLVRMKSTRVLLPNMGF